MPNLSNDRLRKEGLYLQIVRWENFLDAMSETRLQDEYNQKVRECDIFVSCSRPRPAPSPKKNSTLLSKLSGTKENP